MAVPRAQYLALHDTLETVVVNAQAIAAADLAIGTVQSVRDQFSRYSIRVERRYWANHLQGAIDDLRRFRGPMEGMPASPVSPASWDDLRKAIGRAYNAMWTIQEEAGNEGELAAFASYIGETAAGTIAALPDVLSRSLSAVSGAVTETVGAVAKGVLPLWPIVVATAVVVVGGLSLLIFARGKGVRV